MSAKDSACAGQPCEILDNWNFFLILNKYSRNLILCWHRSLRRPWPVCPGLPAGEGRGLSPSRRGPALLPLLLCCPWAGPPPQPSSPSSGGSSGQAGLLAGLDTAPRGRFYSIWQTSLPGPEGQVGCSARSGHAGLSLHVQPPSSAQSSCLPRGSLLETIRDRLGWEAMPSTCPGLTAWPGCSWAWLGKARSWVPAPIPVSESDCR